MPILRYFTFLVHFLWSSGTSGRYLEIFGELDTWKCKFDCGMPDLRVLTLLVSLGFDIVEEEKKAKGKPEENSSTSAARIFIVCVLSSAGCCSTTGYFLQVFVFPKTLQALPSAHPPALQNPVTVPCTCDW